MFTLPIKPDCLTLSAQEDPGGPLQYSVQGEGHVKNMAGDILLLLLSINPIKGAKRQRASPSFVCPTQPQAHVNLSNLSQTYISRVHFVGDCFLQWI